MNVLPICVLYTQDLDLVRQVSGFLHGMAVVRHVENPSRLELQIQQNDPITLLFDLCGTEARTLLPRIRRQFPDSLVVAIGAPRSNPASEAEALGVYAVEEVPLTRQRTQALITRCSAHLELARENRMLKHASRRHEQADTHVGGGHAREHGGAIPLHHFSKAFRNFEKLDTMLEHIVEGVACYARVSRVGLFTLSGNGEGYRLSAGVKCLEDTTQFDVPEGAPLVRWMQIHAHLVCRTTLSHIEDPSERLLLEQTLDTLGAEVFVPLHGRNRILGWLFLGRRVTGIPFQAPDLEELMLLGEYISITLENALLHKEVAVQKTLAETVLRSVPVGIVAVAADGTVRWFNQAAEELLGVRAAEAMHRPAGGLTSRLAGLLARCIKEGQTEPAGWTDNVTKRSLSVLTRRMEDSGECLGAVAIVIDMTREELLRKRHKEIERAAFWAELAAAMSHAVRNPLVAISTFAQLLPERYADSEFRDQFSLLVGREIGRLNTMIDELTDFAHPAPVDHAPLDIAQVIEKAVDKAIQRHALQEGSRIELAIDPQMPPVRGDRKALTDCIMHVVGNAIEAVEHVRQPAILVSASLMTRAGGQSVCRIAVRDNGKGIPPAILQNIYSPFCTEKVRGIGLGLPITRRIVQDHNADLSMDTGSNGTTVTVDLPIVSVEDPAPAANPGTELPAVVLATGGSGVAQAAMAAGNR